MMAEFTSICYTENIRAEKYCRTSAALNSNRIGASAMSETYTNPPLNLRQSGIYLITCRVNGKKYVGQSQDIGKRWRTHIYHAGKPKRAIERALAKHGVSNFTFEVLCFAPLCDLDWLETVMITDLDSIPPNGYNIAPVGGCNRGIKYNEESCKRRGLARRGTHLSPEHKAKLREAGKRRVTSEETRAKLSKALKGKIRSAETIAKMRTVRTGMKHTPTVCLKMSEARKGKKVSPEVGKKLAGLRQGSKNTPEHRAKISAAKRGKKFSLEHCANLSKARKGTKFSPEHVANMVASRMANARTKRFCNQFELFPERVPQNEK